MTPCFAFSCIPKAMSSTSLLFIHPDLSAMLFLQPSRIGLLLYHSQIPLFRINICAVYFIHVESNSCSLFCHATLHSLFGNTTTRGLLWHHLLRHHLLPATPLHSQHHPPPIFRLSAGSSASTTIHPTRSRPSQAPNLTICPLSSYAASSFLACLASLSLQTLLLNLILGR